MSSYFVKLIRRNSALMGLPAGVREMAVDAFVRESKGATFAGVNRKSLAGACLCGAALDAGLGQYSAGDFAGFFGADPRLLVKCMETLKTLII